MIIPRGGTRLKAEKSEQKNFQRTRRRRRRRRRRSRVLLVAALLIYYLARHCLCRPVKAKARANGDKR